MGSDKNLAPEKITAKRLLGRQRIPAVEIQSHLLETRLKGDQIQGLGSLTLFLFRVLFVSLSVVAIKYFAGNGNIVFWELRRNLRKRNQLCEF